jgi:hypothetical protein
MMGICVFAGDDRDLVLEGPLLYRPPGAREFVPYADARAVSIPASRIVSLFVGYLDPTEAEKPETEGPVPVPVPATLVPLEEGAALLPTAEALPSAAGS